MKQDMKEQLLTKRPIDLLFQLSIPAVIGIIVMLRQLFLFVPAMILLPMTFGVKAVWFTQSLVDFIMIAVGIFMMIGELNKTGQEKLKA